MKTKINSKFLICGLLLSFNFQAFSQDPDFHIYLCFGQSNMAGAGTIEPQDKNVDSRYQTMQPMDCPSLQRSAGKWYTAVPPLWGCNGGLGPTDYFGRTMVENLPSNIKIGVIVVGIPGCDIALFNKTGYQGFDTYNQVPSKYNGSGYAWLIELAKLAQKDGVIKGFLLHQGETNSGQNTWPDKVKNVYDDLIKDLGLDASQIPLLAGELLYQNQGGACGGHNSIIAKLPEVLPNSYVISADGLKGKDQFHFTTESNRTFGIRYAEKMLSLITINKTPEVTITSPANNSSFSIKETVTLSANASDPDGNVVCVEFFDDATIIGSDSSAPFSLTWSGMKSGTHKITAKVTDNKGLSDTSFITITIQAELAAYKGKAHQVPAFSSPFSSDGFQIRLNENSSYKITNINGSTLEAGNGIGCFKIGTHLAPGVYFVSIQNKNHFFAGKVLKR